MWVLRHSGVLCKKQIVSEECRAVGQVSRPQNRRYRRVDVGLVSFGELDDHRFGGYPVERVSPNVRCVRYELPDCRTHSMFSRTAWISIAPATVLITGGWFLSGMFSLKCGGPTGIPSMLVIPGELMSDGTRDTSKMPTPGRPPGESRPYLRLPTKGTLSTLARTLGSTARKTDPYCPPKEKPK